jgi:hypothetical protein
LGKLNKVFEGEASNVVRREHLPSAEILGCSYCGNLFVGHTKNTLSKCVVLGAWSAAELARELRSRKQALITVWWRIEATVMVPYFRYTDPLYPGQELFGPHGLLLDSDSFALNTSRRFATMGG